MNKKGNNYKFFAKKLRGNSENTDLTELIYAKRSSANITVVQQEVQELTHEPWYFHTRETKTILEKLILNSSCLADLAEGIFQGVATGKDEVFVVDDETIKKYNFEKIFLRPFLMGKDIGRYKINWRDKFLIYTYDDFGDAISEGTLKQKAPNIYSYLVNNKKNLSGRSYFDKSSKFWYELWNQRNLNRFKQIKIITLDNARRNSFALDESEYLGSTTVYSIILNNKTRDNYLFVLGLLNSSLLEYFHKNNTIPQAGGFYRYQALFIEKLPIIKASSEQQKHIARLVNQILSITKDKNYAQNVEKQTKVRELEKDIDRLVYKLYQLTQEEIRVVEGEPPTLSPR